MRAVGAEGHARMQCDSDRQKWVNIDFFRAWNITFVEQDSPEEQKIYYPFSPAQ